jgi:hypothetical protein
MFLTFNGILAFHISTILVFITPEKEQCPYKDAIENFPFDVRHHLIVSTIPLS